MHPRRRDGGFTLVELIGVLILLAILTATVLPRMTAATGLREEAWRDQVLAAVRHAQSTALTRRRLVCLHVETSAVVVAIASRHGAAECDQKLQGPDGDGAWAHEPSGLAVEVSAGGPLYVQPDGRFTHDPAGLKPDTFTIRVGDTAAIEIDGESGLVL